MERAADIDRGRGARRSVTASAARLLGLAALWAVPSGCVAVAAGGVGLFVSQEFVDNAHVVHYDLDADVVWGVVRRGAIQLAQDGAPVLDDAARTAELQVEGGRAAVRVESNGPRRCRMLIGARKFGVTNASLAHFVMVKLDADVPR